jgi:SAM-dependent methyltransferase
VTEPHEKGSARLLLAMQKAQELAFAPLLFQAAKLLRDRGLLDRLGRSAAGLDTAELSRQTGISQYGATVLCEAGLAAHLLELEDGRYRLTRVGQLWQRDPLTRVNTDFVADVCYRAAEALGESIDQERPVGLAELGDWPTVYEALNQLPSPAKASWFGFDHFYSDASFPLLVADVLARKPHRVLDVGANTGRFALTLLGASAEVELGLADLPQQLAVCQDALDRAGHTARATYHPVDLLKGDLALPAGYDVIWMSQLLSCFSEPEIVHVLSAVRRALGPNGRLFIVETLWDRQKNEVGKVCLLSTSLYFTAVANGRSRMYDGATLARLIGAAGLELESERHGIGWGHSLLACRPTG